MIFNFSHPLILHNHVNIAFTNKGKTITGYLLNLNGYIQTLSDAHS